MKRYIIPICELSFMDCGELLCGSPDYDPVDSTEAFVIDDLESI